MSADLHEKEEAIKTVMDLLEDWGANSKFIWFREIHRLTDIDKGLLRNIVKELKNDKVIVETQNENSRIFYCLKKYYAKCKDIEYRFKGKPVTLNDGSKVKVIQKSTKSMNRTRKRLEKQRQKRLVKARHKKQN